MTIGMNNLGKNGRLGNQMFQYAALVGIAKQSGYDFVIPSDCDLVRGFGMLPVSYTHLTLPTILLV